MDFAVPRELDALRSRTRAFVREQVMPLENDPRQTPYGPSDALRAELVDKARSAGLLTPHASTPMGGLGLNHRAKALIFEEAGYSPLGPVALNIHAPDEGNIHLLEAVADEAQKARWLRPMVEGRTRSCFAMTEPHPGAGSDPSMLRTAAVRDGSDYVINGTKWLITGAQGADFAIIMAHIKDTGATMFLADMDRSGIHIERQMESLDSCFAGGHSVVRFENVHVPATDILGEPGRGLRYAQVRLAPARLTHCMRWLGAAQRAHDVALEYARTRHAFGRSIGEHEGIGFMLADNAMELHQCRLTTWHCAWVLDQAAGDARAGGFESSVAKVTCSEAIWRIVDRSMQILGGQGVTDETVVARIFRDVRPFRIYDGPSEVHRWSIARRLLRQPDAAPAR